MLFDILNKWRQKVIMRGFMNETRIYDCLLEPALQIIVSKIVDKKFPLNTKYLDDLSAKLNDYEKYRKEIEKQYNLKGLNDD